MKNNSDNEENTLNKDSQMASIKTSESSALAAQVIAYRAIGINKDIAIACMEELGQRRNAGDDYDFESYINEEVAKIPKLKGTDYAKVIRGMQDNFKKKYG